MFRHISGPIESIRSIATSRVTPGQISLTGGNTNHETVLRVGGESLRLTSRQMLNLHAGDNLDVAVIDFLGVPHVLRWQSSTGSRGVVANAWQACAAVAAGMVLGLFGLAGSGFFLLLALLCFGTGGVVLWLRAGAKKVLQGA